MILADSENGYLANGYLANGLKLPPVVVVFPIFTGLRLLTSGGPSIGASRSRLNVASLAATRLGVFVTAGGAASAGEAAAAGTIAVEAGRSTDCPLQPAARAQQERARARGRARMT